MSLLRLHLGYSSSPFFLTHTYSSPQHKTLLSLLLTTTNFYKTSFSRKRPSVTASNSQSTSSSNILDQNHDLLTRVSSAKDANEALQIIQDSTQLNNGVVTASDCLSIITAAIRRNNTDLALSIFSAMRSTFHQDGTLMMDTWIWSRPDVNVYTSLVLGLAQSLRVSDALNIVDLICRVHVSPGEEVPFGKVVQCPTCLIAIAVAQPQQGIQNGSCSVANYSTLIRKPEVIYIYR